MHDHSHDPHNFFELLMGVFEEALMITFFVIVMMLLIEYITVQSRGKWNKPMQRSPWLQIIFAALLGLIPGCLGAFTAVSLYVHQVFNFAALVTTMIATSGDEAFVMFSMMPDKALLINLALLIIAVVTGLILNVIFKNKNYVKLRKNHLTVHSHLPDCVCFVPDQILPQLKKISFERALLLTGLFIFLVFLIGGVVGPHDWDWRRITFVVVSAIGMFIIGTVPDHFLKEHLWRHTIKKHAMKIFMWTFAAFFVINALLPYFQLEHWLETNIWMILIIALLVGIIPQSGPNIIFISLFVSGTIPFSILLANSIVQDGHGAIPLLAESRKSFIYMKAVNILVGLVIGVAGLVIGF